MTIKGNAIAELTKGLYTERHNPTVAMVISRLLDMILAALAVDGIKQAFF